MNDADTIREQLRRVLAELQGESSNLQTGQNSTHGPEPVSRQLGPSEETILFDLIHLTTDFVAFSDSQGQIQFINQAGLRMLGRSGEGSGLNDSDVYTETALKVIHDQGLPSALREGVWTGETTLRRVDGAELPISLVLVSHRDTSTGTHFFSSLARDISTYRKTESAIKSDLLRTEGFLQQYLSELSETQARLETQSSELKRTDDALRASNMKYRHLLTYANDAIAMIDADTGSIIEINDKVSKLLDYARKELLGKTLHDLSAPEHLGRLQEHFQQLLNQGKIVFEHILVRKDQTFVPVEISGQLIYAEQGRTVLTFLRNITDRRTLEAQLRQSQKMEAVGRLAGGIAHDFNNLLTAIMGHTDLALTALPPNTAIEHDLNSIQLAAERAAKLTNQLLAFSRKQIIAPKILNLADLVLEIDKLLRRLIGEDIELVTLPGSALGHIRADPGQIEQILANLAVNARDAMPGGGKLIIETSNVILGEDFVRQQPGSRPGEYVLLTLSDTGTGMSQEVKAHLFEPFFTTKEPGRGTGLGLATCYGIIKQNGGYIQVDSQLGKGTTFRIYFPLVRAESSNTNAETETPDMPHGHETILLVEDESTVRQLAARILRQQGYTVLVATNGDDALRLVQEEVDRSIDLLVTDVVMPQMGGPELAERLNETRPGLKKLFISGYTDSAIVHHGVLDPGIVFLQKPFSPAVLTRKVRDVLDGSAQ